LKLKENEIRADFVISHFSALGRILTTRGLGEYVYYRIKSKVEPENPKDHRYIIEIDVITKKEPKDLNYNNDKFYWIKLNGKPNARIIQTPTFNEKYLNEFANDEERPIPPLPLLTVIALENIQENEEILIDYKESGSIKSNENRLRNLLHGLETYKEFSSNDEPDYEAIKKVLNAKIIIFTIEKNDLLTSDQRKYFQQHSPEFSGEEV